MSYRNVPRVLSVVALGAGLVPATMVAQSASYVQQLQGYMNNYASPVMNRGFQAVTQMVTGGLNSSANGSHPVSLNAGRAYVILGVCDNDCSDVDLRLYGPDGSTVIQDLATDDHPTLNFTAPSTGNYRLEVIMATCRQSPCYYGVQLFGGGTGAALNQPTNIQPINTSSPTQMGTIALNQQVSGNLTSMDGRWDNKPTQTWAFACQQGQAFQMNVLSTWDNYAILIDPMGNVVDRDDDDGEGLNARIEHTCTTSGVYRLGVTTYTSSTTPGSYTMQVQGMAMATPMNTPVPMAAPVPQSAPAPMPGNTMPAAAAGSMVITGSIPAPGQVGTVQLGTNVQGRLETGDQRMNDGTWADVWQFQGNAGTRIVIELRSEEFDTYVQLLDAQGNRLAEDDDSLGNLDSKVEFTLTATGMYQIVVNNFSDERRAGIYTLTVR